MRSVTKTSIFQNLFQSSVALMNICTCGIHAHTKIYISLETPLRLVTVDKWWWCCMQQLRHAAIVNSHETNDQMWRTIKAKWEITVFVCTALNINSRISIQSQQQQPRWGYKPSKDHLFHLLWNLFSKYRKPYFSHAVEKLFNNWIHDIFIISLWDNPIC